MNLYIDFDGVIMNTIDVTYEDLKNKGLNTKSPENAEAIRNYYATMDWEELLNKRATFINNAVECINNIVASKKFNVSILTHVTSLKEAVEKINYTRKYLNNITIIPVPRDVSKTSMVKTKNAILIDDYVGNLEEWKNNGGMGVKFSTELKGKGFPVINRLDQILELDL